MGGLCNHTLNPFVPSNGVDREVSVCLHPSTYTQVLSMIHWLDVDLDLDQNLNLCPHSTTIWIRIQTLIRIDKGYDWRENGKYYEKCKGRGTRSLLMLSTCWAQGCITSFYDRRAPHPSLEGLRAVPSSPPPPLPQPRGVEGVQRWHSFRGEHSSVYGRRLWLAKGKQRCWVMVKRSADAC